MDWTEISITANHEAMDSVTQILEQHGSNGVVIEDSSDLNGEFGDRFGEIYELDPNDYPDQGVRVKAYFNELEYNTQLEETLKSEVSQLQTLNHSLYHYETQTIQEVDWANEWKNYFHPFKASERFTIIPSWEEYDRKDDQELCIELDPGMAFGTGDHPTTSMCLKAIERYVSPHHSVIDVGTGSGILSIASYLLGVKKIKAIDVDDMAVQVAEENFEKNHCLQAIETEASNLLTNEDGRYDIIIANILAHIIDEMIEDAYNTLNEEGYFITSGIITEKEEDIVNHMKRVGFSIISTTHDNGWVCIVGQKVSE